MRAGALSVPALLERAQERTGLDGAGDLAATANLRRLVSACQSTAALHAMGRQVLEKVVVRHLVNGLRLADRLRHNPYLTASPPAVALVITGLPRTGTTLLHKLAALDPAHRVLRLWEALSPVPPGPAGPEADKARIRSAEAWLARALDLAPKMGTIHSLSAEGPEECDALLQNEFASQHFDDMFDARDYSQWLYRAELSREYASHALQLRVLEDHDHGTTRPWVLKSPSHLAHLRTLAATYPDAVIVQCHRDPTEAVASWASLVSAVRRPYTDELSARVVGEQCLRRSVVATGRALEARQALGESRFVDVAYRDLLRDPVAVLAEIYHRMRRPLDGDAKAKMRAWVARNPQHRHGRHHYDPAGFGLDAPRVDQALAAYRDRFAWALT